MTQEDVDEVQEWINNYPRKKFDWLCSNDLFRQEVELIL
jgi:IS30 family transposase